MKKYATIVCVSLIRVHLVLSECYDTTYSRCDEFNKFDGYIMSYDAGKLLKFQKENIYFINFYFSNIINNHILLLWPLYLVRLVTKLHDKLPTSNKNHSIINPAKNKIENTHTLINIAHNSETFFR